MRVLLTGRPEVEASFRDWPLPTRIQPLNEDNLADMKLVMERRLVSRAVLSGGENLQDAVKELMDKSKVWYDLSLSLQLKQRQQNQV